MERSEPWTAWWLTAATFPREVYSSIALLTELPADEADVLLPRLLTMADDGLDYAAITAWHDDDIHPGSGGLRSHSRVPAGEPTRSLGLAAPDLRQFLPDLFWGQVFGPPWIELFGAERLASTPCHRTEQVAKDTWLVQLTPHLADVTQDRTTYTQIREAAKQHLGLDCFYDPAQGEAGTYRAAVIPDLGTRGPA